MTMKKNKFSSKSAAQRQRLLGWLQEKGSISTLEARASLDILMPAARIFELRHDGNFNIQLYWTEEFTESGIKHRVGRYILCSGQWQLDNNGGCRHDKSDS